MLVKEFPNRKVSAVTKVFGSNYGDTEQKLQSENCRAETAEQKLQSSKQSEHHH